MGANAIQRLTNLRAVYLKHLKELRQIYVTMTKADALIAEYRAATGSGASLQDALHWKAVSLAVAELEEG